jgi:RNA-directed DNA polymerase
MPFPSSQTTIALADAMLAGPPDTASVVDRLASALGEHHRWIESLAHRAIKRFGTSWTPRDRQDLSLLVYRHAGFSAACNSDTPPVIVRIIVRAPEQRPPPPRLAGIGLPRLPTLGKLAEWLEVDDTQLDWFADRWRVEPRSAQTPLHHYTYKAIEKRDGRSRLIERPKPRLRDLQRKILHGLLDLVPCHDAAHGFRRGRNCVTYATPHAGKSVVIRLDLADFFVSIPSGRIRALFETLGYPAAVARVLTAICTNRVPSGRFSAPDMDGKLDWAERQRYRTPHLPQGAPTSPALANLCAYRLDVRLAALARSMGADYTRYADDLAFSGGDELARAAQRFPVLIGAIALEEGFAVQPRKTRIMRDGNRQHLAGVVVNRHPNLARDKFDMLKAILTNCVRHGPASQNRDGHREFRLHLAGRIAQATMLNPARGAKLKAIFDSIAWE